ncbi:MAG: response regulator [Deltaproteobacteria bacterium]|nr:response regulator [Deltaproteobacteria bacterium]
MPDERILVVDDDPEMLDLCVDLLRLDGFDLVTAPDGERALAVLEREPVDLLLTDIMMPRLDGLELFRRARERYPTLSGIAITGRGDTDTAIRALRLGMAGFLAKPFTVEQLRGMLEFTLEKRRQDVENLRLKALVSLMEATKLVISDLDLQVLLDLTLEIAVGEARADRGTIMLVDEPTGELQIASSLRLPEPITPETRRRMGGQIARWVAQSRAPLVLNEPEDVDPRLREAMTQPDLASALCLPLLVSGRVIGVMNLGRLRPRRPFRDEDMRFMALLCEHAAYVIENARIFRDLQRKQDDLGGRAASLSLREVPHALRLRDAGPLASPSGAAVGVVDRAGLELRRAENEHLRHWVRMFKQLNLHGSTVLRVLRQLTETVEQRPLVEVDVAELVREGIQGLPRAAEGNGPGPGREIRIQVLCQGERSTLLRCDPADLREALEHLLANAREAMPGGGELRVTVQADPDRIRVTVADQGEGMTEEVRAQALQPFFTTKGSRQLGLGLSITYGVIKGLGGELLIDSAPGRGTTVTAVLPRRPGETDAGEEGA